MSRYGGMWANAADQWEEWRRIQKWTELNDRIWGAGNWVVCDACPLDASGHRTFHHKDFHK